MQPDASTDAFREPMIDASPPDASPDAPPDASTDGGRDAGPDASPDSGLPDASPDGSSDGSTGDAGADCERSALCPACPDPAALCDDETPCPVGFSCLPTGCGDLNRCFVIGAGGCDEPSDCSNPNYACSFTLGRCVRVTPGCSTSLDCVPGFACESGTCVDRRVSCSDPADCPHGFACRRVELDQQFCVRLFRPCFEGDECDQLGLGCTDVDGDGARECMPSLTPNQDICGEIPEPDCVPASEVACRNTQCPAPGEVCQAIAEGTQAECGAIGLCNSVADCDAGSECRDLWGDGRKECVPVGGDCSTTADCPVRMLCAVDRAGAGPTCHGAM